MFDRVLDDVKRVRALGAPRYETDELGIFAQHGFGSGHLFLVLHGRAFVVWTQVHHVHDEVIDVVAPNAVEVLCKPALASQQREEPCQQARRSRRLKHLVEAFAKFEGLVAPALSPVAEMVAEVGSFPLTKAQSPHGTASPHPGDHGDVGQVGLLSSVEGQRFERQVDAPAVLRARHCRGIVEPRGPTDHPADLVDRDAEEKP